MRYDPDTLQDSTLVARDLRPDAKKRITLGKALEGYPPEVQFAVYRTEAGQLILDPMIPVPAREAWLFANPKALAAVRRGLEEGARGEAEPVGSFAAFAERE
jgi:hypothetical protein